MSKQVPPINENDLAIRTLRQMGFKEGNPNYEAIEEIISDIAHDFDITGVKQKDSVLIVCRIWTRIYGDI